MKPLFYVEFFLALGLAFARFKSCRSITSIDDTYLYTKLLIVIVIYGDNEILFLTYALVVKKNVFYSKWFLQLI